jgi:hypothetical protein
MLRGRRRKKGRRIRNRRRRKGEEGKEGGELEKEEEGRRKRRRWRRRKGKVKDKKKKGEGEGGEKREGEKECFGRASLFSSFVRIDTIQSVGPTTNTSAPTNRYRHLKHYSCCDRSRHSAANLTHPA